MPVEGHPDFVPVFDPPRCTVPAVAPIPPIPKIGDCFVPDTPSPIHDCPNPTVPLLSATPAAAGGLVSIVGPVGPQGPQGPPGSSSSGPIDPSQIRYRDGYTPWHEEEQADGCLILVSCPLASSSEGGLFNSDGTLDLSWSDYLGGLQTTVTCDIGALTPGMYLVRWRQGTADWNDTWSPQVHATLSATRQRLSHVAVFDQQLEDVAFKFRIQVASSTDPDFVSPLVDKATADCPAELTWPAITGSTAGWSYKQVQQ